MKKKMGESKHFWQKIHRPSGTQFAWFGMTCLVIFFGIVGAPSLGSRMGGALETFRSWPIVSWFAMQGDQVPKIGGWNSILSHFLTAFIVFLSTFLSIRSRWKKTGEVPEAAPAKISEEAAKPSEAMKTVTEPAKETVTITKEELAALKKERDELAALAKKSESE